MATAKQVPVIPTVENGQLQSTLNKHGVEKIVDAPKRPYNMVRIVVPRWNDKPVFHSGG